MSDNNKKVLEMKVEDTERSCPRCNSKSLEVISMQEMASPIHSINSILSLGWYHHAYQTEYQCYSCNYRGRI